MFKHLCRLPSQAFTITMWTTGSTERLSRSNLTTLYHGMLMLFLASIFPRVCLCFVKDTNLSGLFARRMSFSVSRNVLLYQQQGLQGQRLPLIAVVREVGLDRAVDFALAASDAGFKMISVTVDTPEYPRVLNAMAEAVGKGTGERLMFGVSSATSRHQVDTAFEAGASFVSTKELCTPVATRTKEVGLISILGVSSPSTAAKAIRYGADILKAFPAANLSDIGLKDIVEASLPCGVPVIAAGGVEIEDMERYAKLGFSGFALGTTLFRPEYSLGDVKYKSRRFVIEATRSIVRAGPPSRPKYHL